MEEESEVGLEVEPTNGWYSLKDAATQLHISEKTLRKRIKDGGVEHKLTPTRFGPAYQVRLGDLPGVASSLEPSITRVEDTPSRVGGKGSLEEETVSAAELVQLIKDLQVSLSEAQREITEKAEVAALWQGRAEVLGLQLAQSQKTIKALEAPRAEVPEETKPWWRFW